MIKTFVVVDIDGTIAEVGDRVNHLLSKPKDWDAYYSKCAEDKPINDILSLIGSFIKSGYSIVYCSGRRESCRQDTINWMRIHKIPCSFKGSNILLRSNEDKRHDVDVKPEMLAAADRNSMVKRWRELGFRCLQVAEGDF